MLQIRLQRSVGLLRGREIAGLKILAERSEILLERGGGRSGIVAAAAGVMVMMAVMRLTRSLRLLGALLNRSEVLLSGGEIAGLEILAERLKRLEDGIGVCACAGWRG